MDILSSNKVLQLEPLAPLIRQGERLADNPVFVLPKMRDGIDQTALAWEIRATSDHDTIVIQSLTADLTGTDIRLPWVVEGEFTAVAGALYITLCGKSATSNIVVKYVGSTALRVLAAEEGAYTPPANLFEDAVKAGSIAAAAASSAAQSAATAESSKTSAAASANAAEISAASAAESKQSAAASAAAAAESAKQASMPKFNLLDNSDFSNPVNQRGKTTYSAAGYTIDRWAIGYNAITLEADGISITSLPGKSSQFYTLMPRNSSGKTVTFTVNTSDGVFSFTCVISTSVQSKTTPFGKLSVYVLNGYDTVVIDCETKGTKVYWAKFEYSDAPTPYVPKGYGCELNECRRFFLAVGAYVGKVVNTALGSGLALSSTTAVVAIPLPMPMRVAPSISVAENSAFLLNWANGSTAGNYEVATLGVQSASETSVNLMVTGAGFGTYPVRLQTKTAASTIFLSADI